MQWDKDAKNIWERGFQLDFSLLQLLGLPCSSPQALFLTPVESRLLQKGHKIRMPQAHPQAGMKEINPPSLL